MAQTNVEIHRNIAFPQTAPATAVFRLSVNAYFCFIGFATLVYGYFLQRWSRPWIISDWLINYEAGFVRRGLPGELIYRLSHPLHLSPVWMVVGLTLLLYGILLLGLRALALAGSGRFWVLAALLSPATLSFPVIDSEAGFRKELIYLAAFVIFVLLLRRGRSGLWASVYISCALVTAVFSHESLICYAPYFLAALLLAGRTVTQAVRQCIVPFALGAAAAYVCGRHLGNLQTAAHICASLGYPLTGNEHGTQVCDGGAIAYLGYTRAMAREETVTVMREHSYLLLYPVLGLLTLLPLVAGSLALVKKGFAREMRLLWACAGVSFAGSLILFLFAIDWGRWIYLHALSLTVLLLYVDGLPPRVEPVTAASAPKPSFLGYAALAVYAAAWGLPHYQVDPHYRFGYVGLLHHVFFDRHSIQQKSTHT